MRRITAIHIATGNAARGRQDWPRAADAYRRALAYEPHLQHLWVQLAHMEKEAGAIDRAAIAYEEAARLSPADPEPLLHLGHMAKAWRQPAEAAAHFVAALQRDRTDLQAISELVRLMPDRETLDPNLWSAVLSVLDIDPDQIQAGDAGLLPPGMTVFDVTDLLAFFGQRRLPTGIQRVQIEVSLACLETSFEPQPVFCIYAAARRGWIRLPHGHFTVLCRLARQSDDVEDPAWTAQLDRIYRNIAVARTVRFSAATILVNLGTSWSDRNYLLDVRTIRARDAVVYVPLVFDLIPLIGPHWFVQSLVREYRTWFGSLLHSADGCLAISEATRGDLVNASVEWNMPIPEASVPVVRLNGNFRQLAVGVEALNVHGLEAQRYVLFVSTLEPRKNHQGAFEAWLRLIDTLGEAAVPRLVCVGGRGWLNEHLHRMLRERPVLRRLVLVLHGVPDAMLAALYEHCLFVLYPSFYEGWGLPVSEALSYGKVPAISRVSSLPEAGGAYARYFDPYRVEDIAATVGALLDDRTRCAAETAIIEGYRPSTWRAIAQAVLVEAGAVKSRLKDTLPRLGGAGSWSLASPHADKGSDATPPPAEGEALRHGRAWLSPDAGGCGIEGDDAELRFLWAGPPDAVLHVHFKTPSNHTAARIGIDGVLQVCSFEPGIPAALALALPDAPAMLRIAIVPIAGEIGVERLVVTLVTPISGREAT